MLCLLLTSSNAKETCFRGKTFRAICLFSKGINRQQRFTNIKEETSEEGIILEGDTDSIGGTKREERERQTEKECIQNPSQG